MTGKSLNELLEEADRMPEDEGDRLRSEAYLSRTAYLLRERGLVHAAALLLDVELLMFEHRSSGDPFSMTEDNYVTWIVAVLDVEPYLVERFTDERLTEIRSAIEAVTDRQGVGRVRTCRVREALADTPEDWREQLSRQLSGSEISNAARKTRLVADHPQEDGLHFTNEWEQRVYRVLREKQADLPRDSTLGILPLPAFRTLDSTYEPDFLITYNGRAGVIEVDGPHHTGVQRRANDKSREALLVNAGVAWIERIDVRDIKSKEEVRAVVDRLLTRLTERR